MKFIQTFCVVRSSLGSGVRGFTLERDLPREMEWKRERERERKREEEREGGSVKMY